MIARLTAAAILLASFAATDAPAQQKRERVAEIIVFGKDPCPRSTDDEILVCVRRGEAERYRIPERFRGTAPADRSTREGQVIEMQYVGATGTNSCSPVGPGGFTGCQEQLARAWRADRDAKKRAADQR